MPNYQTSKIHAIHNYTNDIIHICSTALPFQNVFFYMYLMQQEINEYFSKISKFMKDIGIRHFTI